MLVEISKVPRRTGHRPPEGERMVRVKMLSSHRAASDHIHVTKFLEAETYVVSDHLAEIFLKEGWAELVADPESQPVADVSHDDDAAVDEGTQILTVSAVRDLVLTIETAAELEALRRGEMEHPQYPGGRAGALEAIDAAVADLNDEE